MRNMINTININKRNIECLRCGYNWIPRVNKPKECPDCKARLTRLNKQQR